MSTFSQRYAAADSNTVGSFPFDPVGGLDYPISKMLFGDAGSVTYVSASNPLPITVISSALPTGAATAANQATANLALSTIATSFIACDTGNVTVISSALPTGAATEAKQDTAIAALAAIQAAVEIMDDWDSSDRCKVDLLTTTIAGAAVKTSDFDTGAGTDTIAIFGIALPGAGGSVVGGTATNPLRIDPTGTTAQTVTQSTAANLNCTEASAAAIKTSVEIMDDWDETDRCKVNLIVGQAGIASDNGASGATVPRVTIANDSTGILAGVTTVTTVTTVSTVTTLTGGGVAHDAADSGNPLKVGGRARSTDIAAVASDDRSDLITDLTGKLIVRPHAIPELTVSGVASTTGTGDTSVIAAAGAGVRLYITSISICNAHASTNAIIEIKDGTTVIWRTAAPAGGGSNLVFDPPLRLTANTALQMASLTGVTTIYFSANGYKGV